MTIASLEFFGFVLLSLIIYYVCPKKFRWLVLLAASIAFYAITCAQFLPYIIFTSLSAWAGALWLDRYTKDRKTLFKNIKSDLDDDSRKKFKHSTLIRRRLILCLILVLNFGILGVIKYFDFFAGWMGQIINIQFPPLGLLLPLGISFYTFQAMGYIIDVYWEKTSPEKNPAKFGLFTSFFPQIVQGPIAIYDDLAGQLYEGHDLKYENIKDGFILFVWGLFQKIFIADRMLVTLQLILPMKNDLANVYSLFAILLYAGQLYMDFSGGIDIVRGIAQMFGINMAINFKRPYFSTSVSDFWRRWHITLGHWLRTYLFYPIALSKAFLKFGKWITSLGKHNDEEEISEDSIWGGYTFAQHMGRVFPGCIATIITFFVIGMWHGANWKYAGFGLWNGIIILISMMFEPVFKYVLKKLKINTSNIFWKIWQIIRTFVLIMIGFIFDLGDNLIDSVRMIIKCFAPAIGNVRIDYPNLDPNIPRLETKDYILFAIGLLIVFAVSLYKEITNKSIREQLSKKHFLFQWLVLFILLTAIVIFGYYGPRVSSGSFVYMQF